MDQPIAFKDMALSILPHLLTTAAKKNQVKNEIVILTATSGDHGKGCSGRLCRRTGDKDYCILPEEWRQPCSGETDGDPERGKYLCGGHYRKL